MNKLKATARTENPVSFQVDSIPKLRMNELCVSYLIITRPYKSLFV